MKHSTLNHRCRIVLRTYDGKVWPTYHYTWNRDVSCAFTLLCEVAATLVPVFESLLAQSRWELAADPLEFPGPPYLADHLIPKPQTTP